MTAPTKTRKESILLIEDDEATRMALKELLVLEGYEVHVLESAESALQFLADNEDWLGVVLSDHAFYGNMTGLELIQRLRFSHRHLPCLLLSANIGVEADARANGIPFLPKPFDIVQLFSVVGKLARSLGS